MNGHLVSLRSDQFAPVRIQAGEPPRATRRVVRSSLPQEAWRCPLRHYGPLLCRLYVVGGTGLEPVTPSLSRRPPRSRLLAAAAELLLPCKYFTLHKHAAFEP